MKRQLLALEEEQKVRRLVAAALKRIGLKIPDTQDPALEDQVEVQVEITMPGDPADTEPNPIRLCATMEQLRCRFEREELTPDQQVYDNIRVDSLRRQLWVDGERVDVTPREFDLLCYFLRHRGLALTRNQLLDGVWEIGFQGDVRTVDTHVKCLRAKLGSFGQRLVTLRKVGYKLEWDE